MTSIQKKEDLSFKKILEQASNYRKEGKYQESATLYKMLIDYGNAPKEIYFNFGNVLFDLNKFQDAKNIFLTLLKNENDFIPALMQLARCEIKLGNLMAAREYFSRILRLEPNHYSAWLEGGHVCRLQGAQDQMIASYQRAVASAPNRWEGLLSLARALEDAGKYEDAAISYHRAILSAGMNNKKQLQEDQPEQSLTNIQHTKIGIIHWYMAKYRLERGDYVLALESIRQALMGLRLESSEDNINEQAEIQIDLAEILMRLGMEYEAHRAFERASLATDESTLARLAKISFQYNLWKEAQEILKRNVELHPQSSGAHWNLAHAYAESWQIDDALKELAKAEEIAPQEGAKSMRASIAGRIGDAETALLLYTELANEQGPYSAMRSSAAMSSLYSDAITAQEVSDLHRNLFAPLGTNSRSIESFKNDRNPNKKLKIGLVSADFHHQHPVNIFMQPILARMDSTSFDITIYFTGVSYDDQTQLAKSRVQNWVECSSWNDEKLTRFIEKDEIDILIDLSGHTNMHRMPIFAKRAAPVQVSFLGYPASTGVPNIDWIIGDNVVTPMGSESLYSEKIIRLPDTVFCFSPEVNYPYPNYDESYLKRPLTFGSFNNVPKLTPHTIALWSKILHKVPDSKLLLKAPSFQNNAAIDAFIKRFEANGIDASRLEFRGPVGLYDMMMEYADIDIALDPIPYNGGTTTLQAMWMGVPVIVKEGNNFVSRMGASFMGAAGMEEWIAKNDEEYIDIAIKMANNRNTLLKLKQSMRNQLVKLPAWNIEQYTQNFEKTLYTIWELSIK